MFTIFTKLHIDNYSECVNLILCEIDDYSVLHGTPEISPLSSRYKKKCEVENTVVIKRRRYVRLY